MSLSRGDVGMGGMPVIRSVKKLLNCKVRQPTSLKVEGGDFEVVRDARVRMRVTLALLHRGKDRGSILPTPK